MNFKKLKRFKRLTSVVLSICMILSMNVTVFATETNAQEDDTCNHDSWGEWETLSEPTCDAPGVDMRSCTAPNCWSTQVREVAALGHSYDENAADYDEFDHSEGVEWETTKQATCLEAGEKTITCQREGCQETTPGHTITAEIPQTDHVWNSDKTEVNPTCTQPGMRAIFCSFDCGTYQLGSEEIGAPAAGHSWSSVVEDLDALTADDLKNIESNASLGITVVQPTCTEGGSIVLECMKDDCDGSEDEKHQEKTFPAANHTFGNIDPETLTAKDLQALTTGNGITITPADCKNEGSAVFQCQNEGCEYSVAVTKTIPALGHNLENVTITTEPTCTDPGEQSGTCSRCTETLTETIPATGHSYGDIDVNELTVEDLADMQSDAEKGILVQQPTCTAEGKLTLTCTKEGCDSSDVEKTFDPLGHDFNEGEIRQGDEATCTEPGTKTYTCQRENCDEQEDADGHGRTYTEEVPALGHTYGNITIEEDGTVKAESLDGIESDPEAGVTIEAGSCTTEGELTLTCMREGCDEYGTSREYRILGTGHDWVSTTYRPMSCLTNTTGMVLKECRNCDAEEWEMIAVKHSYELEGWEAAEENTDVVSEASCTEAGEMRPVCSVCTETTSGHFGPGISIPATGHSYTADGYTWPDEDFAEEDDLQLLDIDEPVSEPSTCTEKGYQYFVCTNENCDATEETHVVKHELALANHDYSDGETTIPATCTQHSKTGVFCKNCGNAEDPSAVVEGTETLTGHTFNTKTRPTIDQIREANITDIETEADLHLDPTCEEAGYDYYICDQATGNSPTCDKTGGYIHREEIVALDHDIQHTTRPATCTHGSQFVDYCDRQNCDYEVIRKTDDDQLEHKYDKVIEVVQAADCATGRSGITLYGCSNGDCGTTEFRLTPAEHSWRNAVADDFSGGDYEYEAGDTAPEKDATCTEKGYQYKICQNCGELIKDETEALNHNYTALASAEPNGPENINGEALSQAPTCTTEGYAYYYCTNEGCSQSDEGHYEKQSIVIDSNAHNFIESTIPATCTEPAKTGQICEYCHTPSEALTESGEPSGHVYDRTDYTDESELEEATAEDLAAEGIIEAVEVEATCVDVGYKYYACPDCEAGTKGHVIKIDVPATGHEYQWNVYEADCTKPGRIVVTCSNCTYENTSIIADQPALEHDLVTLEAVEATCHDTGLSEGIGCSRCDYKKTEQEIIPVDPNNHVWEEDLANTANKDPDCLTGTAGVEVYQCMYHTDMKDYREIPGVHQWKTPEIQMCANNERMPGLVYHQCALCGNYEIMQFLTDCALCTDPAHQNDAEPYVVVKPTTVAAVESTCTVPGSREGKRCPLCDEWFVEPEELETIPHSGDWEVTAEGDCGTPGTRQRRCDTCGELYDEIEELPITQQHTWLAETQGATCTEPMRARRVCSVCREEEEWRPVAGADALGHDWDSNGQCTRCNHYRIEINTVATAADNRASLTAEGRVYDDEGYELVEMGILYATTSQLANMDDAGVEALLTYGNGSTLQKKFSTTSQNWSAVRVNVNVGTQHDRKLAARAYVIVKMADGKEKVIYGDVKVTTYNQIISDAE